MFSLVQYILAGAVFALIIWAIVVLVELRKTLIGARKLIEVIDAEAGPLLAELREAVKEVNSELDRVNDLVSGFEAVRERVSKTTSVLRRAVTTPVNKLSGATSAARWVVGSLLKRGQR